MKKNTLLRLACALTVAGFAGVNSLSAAENAARPNILVILTDDIGWGDYQCYNAQGKIPSPHIDKLASEGMRFTHAHTAAALCAPTRYSMVTGNFPWRGRDAGGTWGFNTPSAILPGQKTVANLLQAAGYRTAMFGKQGFGGQHTLKPDGQPDFSKPMTDGPKRWGFDYSFLIPRGHQAIPLLFLENEMPSCGADKVQQGEAAMLKSIGVAIGKEHGQKKKKAKGQEEDAESSVTGGPGADYFAPDWDSKKVGEALLAHAEKFLDDVLAKNKASGKAAPFFIHFCTDGAHTPYTPADSIRGSALKGQTKMTDHTDMVYETDVLLAKLTEALAKRGLLDNTIICFTSDNGGLPGEREKFGHDAVGGLKGAKSMIAEGGHRVPFIVRWPGKIPANTVRQQPVCTFDIVPSVLELAGVKIPAGQCLDAVSLAPVLLGKRDDSQPARRTMLVQSSPGRDVFGGNDGARKGPKESANMPSYGMAHAVYEGDWKLLFDIEDKAAAFYDLKADLAEKTNLLTAPAQAERVQRLEKFYREIRASKTSTPITTAK